MRLPCKPFDLLFEVTACRVLAGEVSLVGSGAE